MVRSITIMSPSLTRYCIMQIHSSSIKPMCISAWWTSCTIPWQSRIQKLQKVYDCITNTKCQRQCALLVIISLSWRMHTIVPTRSICMYAMIWKWYVILLRKSSATVCNTSTMVSHTPRLSHLSIPHGQMMVIHKLSLLLKYYLLPTNCTTIHSI